MPKPPPSTSVAITNPLHIYRSHVLSSRLLPDPAQHRTALLLQAVYHRLKDYTPPLELDTRLSNLSRALSRRTPTIPAESAGVWSDLRRHAQERADRALVRVVSSADSAREADTPRGFFLHGEVGTGKSLLVDLLHASLPHAGKKRWHFHAFMLHVYAALASSSSSSAYMLWDNEHALLRIARDLVATSPILFLDEMQFPDRAAAKIVSELLVRFWSLGGVLVGSSNRPPRDLVKAAGAGRYGEFAVFEQVFEARCECHRIEGQRDWRRARRKGWWRVGADESAPMVPEDKGIAAEEQEGEQEGEMGKTAEASDDTADSPAFYFTGADTGWDTSLARAVGAQTQQPEWQPSVLTVYGRAVPVPRAQNGVALFTFAELCAATLGPADYIALTARYHTLFIDSVPVLSHATSKNEARRFITLLDTVYEAGVRLAIRTNTSVSIDTLFFPESPSLSTSASAPVGTGDTAEYDMTGDSDSLHGEVFAEAFQDASAPFRPNIAPVSTRSDEGEGENDEDERVRRPDFANVAAFTGEDERFAARRAGSRLWEVCGRGWWEGVNWAPQKQHSKEKKNENEKEEEGEREKGEERKMGREEGKRGREEGDGLSPYRTHPEPPPRFGAEHFWAVVKWGRRAGAWGKGVDAGVEERKMDKAERRVEERRRGKRGDQ